MHKLWLLLMFLWLAACSVPPDDLAAPRNLAATPNFVAPSPDDPIYQPWQRYRVIEKGGGPDGVRLADFNGDGLLDLTVAFESSGDVYLFLNPGPEGVRGDWPSVIVGSAPRGEDAFAIDLDGDGVLDIVSSHEGDTLALYVHWGPADPDDLLNPDAWETEVFPASLGVSWMFGISMDVNQDGRMDFVAGSKSDYVRVTRGEIAWFEAPSGDRRDLSAWERHEIDYGGWIMSLVEVDMNGDGFPDLLVTDRDSDEDHQGVRWLENPGRRWHREWQSHFIEGLAGTNPTFLYIADLDGDGLDDLIIPLDVRNELAYARRLNRTGMPEYELYWIDLPGGADAATPKGVAVMDVNGDGQLDIIVSFVRVPEGQSGMSWASYIGSPLDGEWVWYDIAGPDGTKYDFPALYDVDGDGDLDILTTEEQVGLGVIWFENPRINPPPAP